MERRTFLKVGAGIVCGISAGCVESSKVLGGGGNRDFKISLAQWSFHKKLYAKEMDNLDFASEARRLGFDGIEYVNAFFMDKAKDAKYLAEMNKRASDAGVKSLLIMCDGEGNLGDPDTRQTRQQAVENHHKWVDAAKTFSVVIRSASMLASEGTYDEQMKLMPLDGLTKLSVYGKVDGDQCDR